MNVLQNYSYLIKFIKSHKVLLFLSGATLMLFLCAHPVVSCLVFIIDPVEGFHGAILDAVFGNPLVSVTPTLGQDARHHAHLLQVNLDPLILVVELGEPRTPNRYNTYRV